MKLYSIKNFLTTITLLAILIIIFALINTKPEPVILNYSIANVKSIELKRIDEWIKLRNKYFNNSLSKLGEILYSNTSKPLKATDRQYKILIWKYGATIEKRHMKNRMDPFASCSVKNCHLTYNDEDIENADIVIFHLHRIKGIQDIPKRSSSKQIWAFLTDESPYHTFLNGKSKLANFNGIFNWSMTYRSDSDIPVPYGRTVLNKTPIGNLNLAINKRRDVLVAIMSSNCQGRNHRWQYVKQLQKYLKVDVYGGCGPFKNKCPGHFHADCPYIDQYLFYLSFENSNCDEYITEKLWWNAYNKNAIPIVMGGSDHVYQLLLPLDSYLNVENFATPKDLAEYILHLNRTEDYNKFLKWKTNFRVLNEHGYFQSESYHYCRICEAMNYNRQEKKTYTHLEKFWNTGNYCHPAWDEY